MADKILSKKHLYDNEIYMKNAFRLIDSSSNSSTAAAITDKILSNDELCADNAFMKNVNSIVTGSLNNNAENIDNFLKLLDNKSFTDLIVKNNWYYDRTDDLIQLAASDYENIQKLLSNENLKYLFDKIEIGVKDTNNLFDEIITAAGCEKPKNSLGDLCRLDDEKILKLEKIIQNKNIRQLIDKKRLNLNAVLTLSDMPDSIIDNIEFYNKKIDDMIEQFINRSKTLTIIDNIDSDSLQNWADDAFLMFYSDIIKILASNPDEQSAKIFKAAKFSPVNFIIFSKLSGKKAETLENHTKQIDNLHSAMLAHPERYINGNADAGFSAGQLINIYFEGFYPHLTLMSYQFDKETLNVLMRKRLDTSAEILKNYLVMNDEDRELLGRMAQALSLDGKPFLPAQKLSFIDLITAYNACGVPKDNMIKAAEAGIIDTGRLNIELFDGLLKKCGFTDKEIKSIPPEKIMMWDINNIYLLAKEAANKDSNTFMDFFKAANLQDFNEYIHDTSNIYGKTNAETKKLFENCGLNYQAWLKPSEKDYIQFYAEDKNSEQLEQIIKQIEEDIETLRTSGAKAFIDKQLKQCIKEDVFKVPSKYKKRRTELSNFVKGIQKQLAKVFERAEKNNNAEVLTIQNHLKQRLDDISKIPAAGMSKTLDLTIKMWDRLPQKDIFQGNYSTCCIGIGQFNSWAMPHYLMNTAYNMIELKDNISDRTIGNALCYFVLDNNEKPAFIIDNIEINNAYKPSDETGKQLRTAMAEYAAKVSKEASGRDDIEIYMSSSFNDVPCDDLEQAEKQINFLGQLDCDEIYMDLYGGLINKNKLPKNIKMLKLK